MRLSGGPEASAPACKWRWAAWRERHGGPKLDTVGPGSFYSFSFSDFPFLSYFQVQFEFEFSFKPCANLLSNHIMK